MKPFNLEAALAGARVVTIDGSEVTQLMKFNTNNDEKCLVGVVSGVLKSWYEDGKYSHGDRDADLFMAPNTKCIWVARYVDGIRIGAHPTKWECKEAHPDADDYHEITYEEQP